METFLKDPLGSSDPAVSNHRHHTVKLLSKQMLTSAGAILRQTMCFRCWINTPLFSFMTCKAHKVTGEKNKATAFQTEVCASPRSPLPLITNTVDGARDVRENHLPVYDQKKHNKVDEQGNANKERKRRQILRGSPEGFENMLKPLIFSPWLHCYTDFLSFSHKKY